MISDRIIRNPTILDGHTNHLMKLLICSTQAGPLYRSLINWKTREISITSLWLFEPCVWLKLESWNLTCCIFTRTWGATVSSAIRIPTWINTYERLNDCYFMLGIDHFGRSHEPHESHDHLEYPVPFYRSLNISDTFIIDPNIQIQEIIKWGFEARPNRTLRKTYGIFILLPPSRMARTAF